MRYVDNKRQTTRRQSKYRRDQGSKGEMKRDGEVNAVIMGESLTGTNLAAHEDSHARLAAGATS